MYTVFHSEDIGLYICLYAAKSSKNDVLGPRSVEGEDIQDFGHAF